jgi:hypothetical protein
MLLSLSGTHTVGNIKIEIDSVVCWNVILPTALWYLTENQILVF